MAPDVAPQFEASDLLGTTSQFVGTVGTTPISVPAVAGKPIAEVLVRAPSQTPPSIRLQYSFDGGSNYSDLAPGEFVGWSLKGSITQVLIKGSTAGVLYEVIMNREP